jgi:hypothetical protein
MHKVPLLLSLLLLYGATLGRLAAEGGATPEEAASKYP